jgi:hypothetical protein
MSQNRQNTQNHPLAWAARNCVAAGKRAGWPLSTTKQKGFVGFCKFCDKKHHCYE